MQEFKYSNSSELWITMKILDASAGFSEPLSEQGTKNFRTTNVFNVHLGTVDGDGYANIHPAWYYYDASKEKIYVVTGKESKKMENLKKNRILYFCIDDQNPRYKGVCGKGNVKIHEDVKFNIPIAEKIHVRCLGTLDHPISKSLLEALKKGQLVVLEIRPKYYATWDDSKLHMNQYNS